MAFIKHKKVYNELKNGDLILNGFPDWKDDNVKYFFKKINEEELKSKYIIHLENFGYSTLETIKKLNLNVDFWNQFKYKCPFNGYTHMSLVPSYICVDDINKFKDVLAPYIMDILRDKDYMKNIFYNNYKNGKLNLSKLQELLIGSGYTEGSYPNDGSSNFSNVVLEEEDGTLIICKLIIWYNR